MDWNELLVGGGGVLGGGSGGHCDGCYWMCFIEEEKEKAPVEMGNMTTCYPVAAICEKEAGPSTNE